MKFLTRGIVFRIFRTTVILFQPGCTHWGFQIGRLYLFLPYFRYVRAGVRPTVGWDRSDKE